MSKSLWSGAIVAIALQSALRLTALTPSPSPSQAAANLVTVRGCIRRTVDIQSQSKSSLDLSDPNDATQFVLVKAPTKAEAPIYRLDDLNGSVVSAHVGHEVELSGTLIDENRHDPSGVASKVPSPKLVVKSIRMIASSCPNEP